MASSAVGLQAEAFNLQTDKSTSYSYVQDFWKFCQDFDRPVEHVRQFLAHHLSSKVGLCKKAHDLVLDQSITKENLLEVLFAYAQKYVICHKCQSCRTRYLNSNLLGHANEYVVCKEPNCHEATWLPTPGQQEWETEQQRQYQMFSSRPCIVQPDPDYTNYFNKRREALGN